jgi:prepilin peptidase CpaA
MPPFALLTLNAPLLNGPLLSALVLFLCVGLLGFAALHDVIARTIPNWVPAAVALLALLTLLFYDQASGGLRNVALAFGAMGSGALLCWRLGWLGGGDAKLLGAVGLLVSPGRMAGAVAVIGLAGGVLALPYVVCRGRIARPRPARPSGLLARGWRAERFRLRRGGPLPYAVAIAVGTAFSLLGGPP